MRKFLLHLLFWSIFFLIWNRIMYFYIDNTYNRLYFSALDVALVASAFYLVYLYIIPAYIRHRNLWKLIGFSAVLLIILAGVYAWLMGIFLQSALVPIRFDFSWNYTDLQYNRFFIALLGVLAGGFVKLSMDRLEMSRRLETMEKEKSTAELNYLKSQLNPHFLFNSLNTLHAQMELNMAGAKQTLVTLSNLLRYQLYECRADFIPLEREIDHLRNFFDLQQMRLDNCKAVITVTGDGSGLLIAPMLCMAFMENAFKHLANGDSKGSSIKILIAISGQKIEFVCTNTANNTSQGQGIGLSNVGKRLEMIYPKRYTLTTQTTKNTYKVKLMINL